MQHGVNKGNVMKHLSHKKITHCLVNDKDKQTCGESFDDVKSKFLIIFPGRKSSTHLHVSLHDEARTKFKVTKSIIGK